MKIDGSNAVQILVLIGGLSLLPAILFTVTGFTRILIVLGFIRTAMGTQHDAPQPGAGRDRAVPDAVRDGADDRLIKKDAWEPLQHHQITMTTAIARAEEPLREFMFKQTRAQDLALFVSLAHLPRRRRAPRSRPTC